MEPVNKPEICATLFAFPINPKNNVKTTMGNKTEFTKILFLLNSL